MTNDSNENTTYFIKMLLNNLFINAIKWYLHILENKKSDKPNGKYEMYSLFYERK